MARSPLHRRYGRKLRKNPDDEPERSRKNPTLLTDIAEYAIPGFGGFAATRLATHVVAAQVEKRKPSWGKHAGAVASVGSFLAAWLLAHRWRWLEQYHTPVVVGSAIATATSLVQLYIPSIGWVMSDPTTAIAGAASSSAIAPPSVEQKLAAANIRVLDDDPNEYTYNDSFDAGRYGKPAGTPPQSPDVQNDDMSDLEVDDAIGQNLGVFST